MEFIAGTSEHLPEHNISPARPFHRTDIAELHGRAVQIHEHLIQFGNAVEHVRSESVTPLQRALHHLQCAYRSFQGLMVGVPDKLLDCGESTPRGSIRHLLLSSLSFYCCHAPIDEPGVLEEPAPQGLWKFSSLSPPVVANSGCMTAESLSALFERGERLHSSVVEKLRGITHQPATSAHSIHIQEQLSHGGVAQRQDVGEVRPHGHAAAEDEASAEPPSTEAPWPTAVPRAAATEAPRPSAVPALAVTVAERPKAEPSSAETVVFAPTAVALVADTLELAPTAVPA